MNPYGILLTGVFAGGVSCAAMQGGLLAGLVKRQHQQTTTPSAGPRFVVRLADDLAPVAGFRTGKLLSHTLRGALLGSLGAAVQLSVAVRTMTQIAAGALVVVFGLAQLGATRVAA
jgi:sulfite exporter TauE/SafE